MIIRSATPADADGVGLVHVRSWQVAYAGLLPQSDLDGLDPAQRSAGWRRYLSSEHPDEAMFVAAEGGDVVGFVNVGPCRDDDGAGLGELRAIYLLPDRWGAGVGWALQEAGLGALAEAGFVSATLWVLEGNERGRRFYERTGWTTDGTVRHEDRLGFTLDELRYRRLVRPR